MAQISPAEAIPLQSLIAPTEQGIASRVLAKTSGGNVTLFAFDAGQGLSEHSSPFEALVFRYRSRWLRKVHGWRWHPRCVTLLRCRT